MYLRGGDAGVTEAEPPNAKKTGNHSVVYNAKVNKRKDIKIGPKKEQYSLPFKIQALLKENILSSGSIPKSLLEAQ